VLVLCTSSYFVDTSSCLECAVTRSASQGVDNFAFVRRSSVEFEYSDSSECKVTDMTSVVKYKF